MPRLPGMERPRFTSVKAYLSELAKDIAEIVVEPENIQRFREQLRIYNKLWTAWIISDEADRNGCWTPSMGRPEHPLNVFSRTYNLRYDSEKEIKRLPGFYSILSFIHDNQLPNLDKINNDIVSSEIAQKTLSAPRHMLEARSIDSRTHCEDVREIYLIEEYFNHVKIDLKEHCEKDVDKTKLEEIAKTAQDQQVKTLSDIELFGFLAEKFKKRTIRVLEPDETWQSLDRSLKEYFDLAIHRLQLRGLTDNKLGLLRYQYKNLLHFARGINFKSFRGFPDSSIASSARKNASELAKEFKDFVQRAKENSTPEKPTKYKKKHFSRKDYDKFSSIHHDFSLLIDPPSEITNSEFASNKTKLCYKIEMFYDRFVQICGTLGISLQFKGEPELIDPAMVNYARAWCGQTDLPKSDPKHPRKFHVNLDMIKNTISSLTKSGQPKASLHESYPSNLAKAEIDKMFQAQLAWRRDKIKQIFDDVLIRLRELFETRDKKKTKAKAISKIDQENKDTKGEEEGTIKPIPPEILQKILWLWKYGLKHWKLVLLAGLLFLASVLLKCTLFKNDRENTPLGSKASGESNAHMEEKFRKLEEQVQKTTEMAAPPTLSLMEGVLTRNNLEHTRILWFKPSKNEYLGRVTFEANVIDESITKIIEFRCDPDVRCTLERKSISEDGKQAHLSYSLVGVYYPRVELRSSGTCKVQISGSHIPEPFFIDIE